MKAYKKVNRKYYKWTAWNQPILTSNPQNGYSITGSNYSGDLKILSDGTKNNTYVSPSTTSSYGCIIEYIFPINLRISSISINYLIQTNVTYAFSSFKIVAITKTGEQVISTTTPANVETWGNQNYIVNNVVCNGIKIYCSGAGSPHPRLGEITITAEQPLESTQDDYDYYIDTPTYQLPLGPKKEYYKYIDISWTNPSLTSNTTWGTVTKMDNSDNIISDSNMYKAFNGSTAVGSANTYEFWGRTSFRIKWTMPEKVKVTNIQMWGQNASDTYYSVTGFTAWAWDYSTNAYVQLCTGSYGAEGGTYGSWTVTPIETDIFRFYVAGYPSDPGYRPTALREIKLTGTIKDLRKGDIYKDNYDFYKIVQAPLGINV